MDTLTRIRAFIDVVDAEGYSAAARKQGRSKALLSKYVKELEDELGALLLNRTTRQFSLTDAGKTYYRTANEILNELDNLADLVREGNSDLKGRLKISVPRTFVDADAGMCLIDFARQHPNISLEISAEDRFADLVEEGFDLAIRITKLEDSGLIARKITDFRLKICASPEFIEKNGPFNHPSSLIDVPCMIDTNSKRKGTLRFEDPQEGPISIPVSGPIEVNSPIATLRGALAGLGVALLPDFVATKHIESGELISLFDSYMLTDRGVYAVYPHRRHLPAKVKTFVDFLQAWFKKA